MAINAAHQSTRPRSRVTPGAGRWLPVLLIPLIIGLGLVYFAAIEGLALGFTDWNLISPASFIGLDNYRDILDDPRFWTATKNTVVIVLLTVPGKIAVGFVLALALNKIRRFSSFFRLALFFPVSCSVVAVAFIWTYLYDADGVFNRIRAATGRPQVNWLEPGLALWSVSAMIIWAGVGYVALLFVAGLQSIPLEYYDAATVDGANRRQQLRHITLPLLTPTTFFVLITAMIAAMQTFGEVYVLTGPVDSTLTIMSYIYERAFTGFEMGYAAALSAFLIAAILLVTVVQLRLQRRWVTYEL